MSNLTSNSAETELTSFDDILVTTVWATFILYGLASNSLIIVGILRNRMMRSSTSYWLIIHMSACDNLMLFVTAVHILPATVLHDRFVRVEEFRNAVAMFFYDTFWYTGVVSLAFTAVNRLISVVYPTSYAWMFTRGHHMWVVIGLLYVGGILVSIPALFDCCLTLWDHRNYVTFYQDPHTAYLYVDILLDCICVIVMFGCYAVVVMKVRSSRRNLTQHSHSPKLNQTGVEMQSLTAVNNNNDKRPLTATQLRVNRREVNLLVQFCVVSLVFFATFLTWQILPQFLTSKWVFAFTTCLFLVNNCTNPTVYLIFNKTLRKEIRTFLAGRREFPRLPRERLEKHRDSQ